MPRWVPSVALGLAVLGWAGTAGALTVNPVVAPGHPVVVNAGGFAGRAVVTVQLAGRAGHHLEVSADDRGRIRARYPAPLATGSYRLVVSGRSASVAGTQVSPSGSDAVSGDDQIVTVTVPLVVDVPFEVGGFGVDPAVEHAGSAPLGHSHAGLATTGTDLRTPLVIAAVLGLLGTAFSAFGRRRAHL